MSDPIGLEEKESPDAGLKMKPASLVAIFFLNLILMDDFE
jgi:hypothetical protein